MIELVYVSAAVRSMTGLELRELLARSRAANDKLGLTGLLLHDRGSFLQVLEGDPVAVEALFAKIARDARHGHVTTLLRGSIGARNFTEWSMGFVSMDDRLRAAPGFSPFLGPGFSVDSFLSNSSKLEHSAARQMLVAFRDGRLRSYVDV